MVTRENAVPATVDSMLEVAHSRAEKVDAPCVLRLTGCRGDFLGFGNWIVKDDAVVVDLAITQSHLLNELSLDRVVNFQHRVLAKLVSLAAPASLCLLNHLHHEVVQRLIKDIFVIHRLDRAISDFNEAFALNRKAADDARRFPLRQLG